MLLVDGSNTYNTINSTHRRLPLFDESQEDQEEVPAERLSKHHDLSTTGVIRVFALVTNLTKGRRQNSLSVTTNEPKRMTNVGD